MMDLISGAFTTLKTAADITQALVALKTDAAVSAKAVELNGVIFSVQQQLFAAQNEHAALVNQIRDLESQIANLKNWAQEKERYQLQEVTRGTFVYRIKPEMKGEEPSHDLCANCYAQGVKSIVQYAGSKGWVRNYSCPRCKAHFMGEFIGP